MNYLAKVLRLGDDIEEEVVLEINGFELTCFSMSLSSEAKVGQSYQIELEPMVIDDYIIHELSDDVLR